MEGDALGLGSNRYVLRTLDKNGVNFPTPEVIHFSAPVIKINRKGKMQHRVLVVTDKAVYNLKANRRFKLRRRIPMAQIARVTVSNLSQQMVIHVPEEYDYLYVCDRQADLCACLKKLYASHAQMINAEVAQLAVVQVEDKDLRSSTLTRVMARLQTREEKLQLRKQLVAEAHHSDEEEGQHIHSSVIHRMPLAGEPEEQAGQGGFQEQEEQGGQMFLQDFELLQVIGRGSFGKVMLVRKKQDGCLFAMKILKKEMLIVQGQVAHTKAERRVLEKMQHPFLMRLRSAFQTAQKLYFVLDYYPGGELFFHLKKQKRFNESAARIYVAEIALALGHLHTNQMIYRDLKPENVLLGADGHLCLTDFGLSKFVTEEEKTGTFCGTPEYLAPEILAGVGHDKGVDWWSLGILLYELVVGIPPFYSENTNEMYNKIQHGVLRFPPFLSDRCKGLILGLLTRDPRYRLGSQRDVADVISHPFFYGLDLNLLMQKAIPAPLLPDTNGGLTINFDNAFTSEPVVDSFVEETDMAALEDIAHMFSDFNYAEKDPE